MTEIAFLYDDAYITLASAQALWRGHDPYFAGTPPIYGITSPFHCLVVAALLTVFPPLWALLISCLAGAGLYAWGLWRLARLEGADLLVSSAFVVAGLGAGMLSQHMVNGLETSWAMAAVTWMLIATSEQRPAMLAVLAGTAPSVRPELAVPALVLLIAAAFKNRSQAPRLFGYVLLAFAPWVVFLVSQTGFAVPASLTAKRDWYAEGCWSTMRRLTVAGAGLQGWLWSMPLVGLGVIGLVRTRLGRLALGSATVILGVWAWSVPNVLHSYQRHRYFAPFVPLLLLGLLQLPRRVRSFVVVGAGLSALVSTAGVVKLEPEAIAEAAWRRSEIVAGLARQSARRVLLHDAGFLAYSGAVPVGIDMVGLKTPRAASLHAQYTGPSCGAARGKALEQLALETGPTHLVIWEPWDRYFDVSARLQRGGWSVSLVETVSRGEPIFIYSLAPPHKAMQTPAGR